MSPEGLLPLYILLGCHIAAERGRVRAALEWGLKELARGSEQCEAQMCARAEHLIHVVKNLFGRKKVCHKELEKSSMLWQRLFAMANV
jgi:IS5 family transposase